MTPIQSSGGWPAVDALFTKMPESTEQILHPDKYTAGEAPIKVTLPDDLATRLGTGWSVPLQDTFGEYQLGIWLREGGVVGSEATAAAAGWGGDRLAVMEGPDGAWAVVLDTTWDTDNDADRVRGCRQHCRRGLAAQGQHLGPGREARDGPDRVRRRNTPGARRHIRRDRSMTQDPAGRPRSNRPTSIRGRRSRAASGRSPG